MCRLRFWQYWFPLVPISSNGEGHLSFYFCHSPWLVSTDFLSFSLSGIEPLERLHYCDCSKGVVLPVRRYFLYWRQACLHRITPHAMLRVSFLALFGCLKIDWTLLSSVSDSGGNVRTESLVEALYLTYRTATLVDRVFSQFCRTTPHPITNGPPLRRYSLRLRTAGGWLVHFWARK